MWGSSITDATRKDLEFRGSSRDQDSKARIVLSEARRCFIAPAMTGVFRISKA
jgi:hypothetical protein